MSNPSINSGHSFITLYFTKVFIGGHLDGLTYETETTFTSKARAEQFIKRGQKVIKGIGADYKIIDATFEKVA